MIALYPHAPGFKRTATSEAAAASVAKSAAELKDQLVNLLQSADYTSDELAKMVRRDKHNVRSRCSELCAAGSIFDSGMTRINDDSGKSAIVWTVGEWRYTWGDAGNQWKKFHKDNQQPNLL